MRSVIALLMLVLVFAGSMTTASAQAEGQNIPPTPQNGQQNIPAAPPPQFADLMRAIYVLFAIVFIGMPLFSVTSAVVRKWVDGGPKGVGLRGLNLPNGSVRAMLGLLTVGSFVLVLAYGLSLSQEGQSPYYNQVITAFGTLAGSITGFYFGGRVAAPPPPPPPEPPPAAPTPPAPPL